MNSTKCLIIGSGPAGLFASLRLIELGLRPILLERGREVSARKVDIARINQSEDIEPRQRNKKPKQVSYRPAQRPFSKGHPRHPIGHKDQTDIELQMEQRVGKCIVARVDYIVREGDEYHQRAEERE